MPGSPTASVASHRGQLAALTRHRPAGDPAIASAKRDLRAAVAEEYVRRLLGEAPPLTDTQRLRLASILAGTS